MQLSEEEEKEDGCGRNIERHEILTKKISEKSTHHMSKSRVPTERTHEGNLDFASVMIISSKAL